MKIQLGNQAVGVNAPPFVIAEVGSNHDGSLETAKDYIRQCAKQGVDAVKFQLFRAETLVNSEVLDERNQWVKHPANELLKSLEVPSDWLEPLHHCCRESGVLFTCTPFDEEAVSLLESVDIPFYKIASGELTHRLFLETVAATKKPIVLSTGMGNLDEVRDALEWLRTAQSGPVIVLHCVSQYPPEDRQANLNILKNFSEQVSVDVFGFSDHSPGVVLSSAAVALGARVIEKHVTFDRNLPGPDHPFAITLDEMGMLVRDVNRVFEALGDDKKMPVPEETEMRTLARRGLWAARALKKGAILSREDVRVVRPCLHGSAADLKELLGKTIPENVEAFRALPSKEKWN